jgi:hypothetical protein
MCIIKYFDEIKMFASSSLGFWIRHNSIFLHYQECRFPQFIIYPERDRHKKKLVGSTN